MLSRLLSGKQLPKTPKALAFGVFVWAIVSPVLVTAACPAAKVDETVQLAQVVDGDTLRLQDGRRVRVLGINTPEVARKGQAGEVLGVEASAATRAFLPKQQKIHLVYDRDQNDRYGRVLAHVYNAQRQSLAAHLLERGLAVQVVVPPNLSEMKCLRQQEARARQQNKGIWREKGWQSQPAASIDLDQSGFSRIRGKITKVTILRDIWLELDGPVVMKIAQQDRHYFPEVQWQSWVGQHVEVRGWLINRASEFQRKRGFKPLQIQVRHPLMFEDSPDAQRLTSK